MAVNVEIVNRAWNVVCESLTPGKIPRSLSNTEVDFQNAVQALIQNSLGHIIEEWFLENLQQYLRLQVAAKFWSYFEPSTNSDVAVDRTEQLSQAVEYLHTVVSDYAPCFSKLESVGQLSQCRKPSLLIHAGSLSSTFILLIKAVVFNLIPRSFKDAVDVFYSQAFKVFHHSSSEEQEGDDDGELTGCKGCGQGMDKCRCQDIMVRFHKLNAKLDDVGILERVSGSAVTAIVHERIKQHVESTCKGNFETSYLDNLQSWLETKVLGWLHLVYSDERRHTTADCISGFKGRLLHFLFETYAKTQIDQLFNIIIEYPESEPAILDLKVCLEKTDQRPHLVTSLKSALETRLLHPGVNTSDILTAYIAAIRALRVLDPAGVILELVCDPVRKYLRSRDDTVRCIVSNLTDDGSNELLDELIKGQPLLLDEGCHSDDEDEDWEKWIPDPVDADPSTTSKSRRASDIISMLVNIYGSKELFVNEYRTLLADRILTQFNYDIEKEIRYLELLKLRFGEAQLHYCEVMLKDVANSKRLNSRVVEERSKGTPQEIEVNAMILSAQFWPAFREEKIALPDIMQNSLECYTKVYETLKGNRTLNWKPHLGLVNVDIELKDRTLTFNVSPVHAAIIMQFENQARWTIEELSNVLQMPATALRRKIAYWQTQGLLKEETTDTFILIEEHKGRTHDVIITDDDEAESAMASAHAQREEELQVFWSYIVGMLTNLESLPLERIHSMLRMFAMQGPSALECSVPELKEFLDRKVKEQKLIYSAGVYRLPKPS